MSHRGKITVVGPCLLMTPVLFLCLVGSTTDAAIYVVSNTGDSGGGSLRNAIIGANANTGADQIHFAIPGSGPHTIWPLSDLPTVTDTLTIDGTTQTGYSGSPLIELDGSLAGALANGLTISAPECTVRALVVNRFTSNGILFTSEADYSAVKGCYIGTDINGTSDRGNHHHGICIFGAFYAEIGGENQADRNVISGNDSSGVCLRGLADNVVVTGNYIGTNVTGTGAVGNAHHGVYVHSAYHAIIGSGISVSSGNVISGNGRCGIHDAGNASTSISGNYIGTAHMGSGDIGNGWHGVDIDGGVNTFIGGPGVGAGNLISGNDSCGVIVRNGTYLCSIRSNIIGLNAAATAVIGNIMEGVRISGSTDTQIGGSAAGERNIISGHISSGIEIRGSSSGTQVQGNYVGLDGSGTIALGNLGAGIHVCGPANTIGGTSSAARNVISGNNHGILLEEINATGNLVTGNYIGTDATGTAPLGNNLGVTLYSTASNTIGGAAPGAGNVVSGNSSGGIIVWQSSFVTILGNRVGTTHTGTDPLGNGESGIYINGTANTVGGSAEGEGNIIAFNGEGGVVTESLGDVVYSNRISGNSIHSNANLGIDLADDGVTLNDLGDTDTGANELRNHPVLTMGIPGPPVTLVDVYYNSTPTTSFRFEFFRNELSDPTSFGEGQTLIGWTDATTDGSGNVSFGMEFTPPIPYGRWITATATDISTGNTSEFSQGACVGGGIELAGEVSGGALQLQWSPVYGAVWYTIHGVPNEPYFSPTIENEIILLSSVHTTWSGLPAVGNPEMNWTYIVKAQGCYEQEMARSNRFAEFEFGY
jgi:hypothetical protein